jgi:predicted O-linked N-acetylglucosamine transferase (SPINDLY family)
MPTIPETLQLALQHHQAGRLPEAEALYRQVLQIQPDHPTALQYLGVIAHQVGRHEAAVQYIAQALCRNPQDVDCHNNIGEAYRALGKLEEAKAHYLQALSLNPSLAEAHNNLGNLLRDQGMVEEAIAQYRQAVALKPAYAEAFCNLGLALQDQGKLEEALAQHRQALALRPAYAEAHHCLGNILQAQGRVDEAIAHYRQTVALKPADVEGHHNLGIALEAQGRAEEAEAYYRQALALRPNFAAACNNLGNVLKEQGKLDEAVFYYRQALALKPESAEINVNLGLALQAQGELEEATVYYRQAVALKPTSANACICLGNVLKDLGKPEEAEACYSQAHQALDVEPSDGLKIKLATMLPVIYESVQDVPKARRKFKDNLDALLKEDLSLKDPAFEIGQTNFYLAYQGRGDRELQVKIAQLYERACPLLLYTSPHCAHAAEPKKTGKIKVGFVSRFFRDHTVGHLMCGILANLSQRAFSTTVFSFPHEPDNVSKFIAEHADRVITLPSTVNGARIRIAQEEVDILYYADIGMDPVTYCLAFSRLAPVQCVTWGHPVTTGIKTIDYFVSSELLEPDRAERHYSEKLVRLRHLPTYYFKPPRPVSGTTRRNLGFAKEGALYLCPQSLFKIHPDFDQFLGGILQRVPQGEVVLLEGHCRAWSASLMRRLQKAIPDVVGRVRFHPRLSRKDYIDLLSVADVILDPVHWSGGNTTFEALSLGIPIVTLPSEFMRGRVTYGCYRQMGMMDCVASTREEYVALAVRLGTDPAYRQRIRAKILAANGALYENINAVREMERFFLDAIARHADHS